MRRKNLLKLFTAVTLTAMALTACSKETGTTPQTQPHTETAAPETTAPEQSDGSLTGTEKPETTEKETKEDSSSAAETTRETTTAEQTASSTETKDSTKASSTEETTPPETTTEETTTAHTHDYSSAITKEAACMTEGVMTYTCECGDTYTEGIPAAGHSFGAYTYNNDATDLADGTETAICSVCGASDTRTAAGTKLEHIHSYTPYVSSYPTCTTEGVMTSTCECGDSYTEPINATGHSFGTYTYNNDATYEADGTETAECSVCGAKDTRTAEGTKLVQETTEAVNRDDLQSYFDWMKENCSPYGLECMYAQEGFTETFPFVWDVSDTQYKVYYLEGDDSSPADEFRRTHNMSIWGEHTYCMGQFKEGIVWIIDFGRNSY